MNEAKKPIRMLLHLVSGTSMAGAGALLGLAKSPGLLILLACVPGFLLIELLVYPRLKQNDETMGHRE